MGTLSDHDVARWAKYAMKIECARCGEAIFVDEQEAIETIQFAAEHYDLDGNSAASEWRLYLCDCTRDGLCDYCEHMMTKDD
jgi:hypothetical protein